MKYSRVEEDGIAFGQWQLHAMFVEVVAELRAGGREVPGPVGLRVRQVQRRTGLDGHVAVRHRALKGQHRRQRVDVRRELLDRAGVLEAEVVVAVRDLRGTAGFTTFTCDVTWYPGPSQAVATWAMTSLA